MHYSGECQYLAQCWQPEEGFRICRQLLSVKINQSDAGWPWRGDPGAAPVVQCTKHQWCTVDRTLVKTRLVQSSIYATVPGAVEGRNVSEVKKYLVRQERCHKAVQGQTIGRATFTGDARCQPDRWETIAPRHKKNKYTTQIQIHNY